MTTTRRNSRLSRRKPARVTDLDIKGPDVPDSLGVQVFYNGNSQSTTGGETPSNFEWLENPQAMMKIRSQLNSDYQTWRMLHAINEGNWTDAEESLSLGADVRFVKLFKDKARIREAAWFIAHAIAGGTLDSSNPTDITSYTSCLTSGSSNNATMKENGKSETRDDDDDGSCRGRKEWFKWGLAALNLMLELCQAVTTQEAMKQTLLISSVLSSVCLILSMWETVHELRKDGVKWRKRGRHYFFYYPGKKGHAFGTFCTWFGLITAMVQFAVNCVSLVTKNSSVIKFDYVALLFSTCYLIWTVCSFSYLERSVMGVVKCGSGHKEYELEGKFVKGTWVFQCLQCKMEKNV